MASIVNMAAFMCPSLADGPGKRAVVWVQGCPHCCPGCRNRHMQAFEKRTLMAAATLAKRVLGYGDIGGVTFTGGEPFCQARALARVASMIRDEGMSVVTYSGFTIEQLRHVDRADWNALLEATDLLIDGPFVQNFSGDFLWRGSSNQRLHVLTDRITLPNEPSPVRVQITVGSDGKVQLSGFPSTRFLESLERRNMIGSHRGSIHP